MNNAVGISASLAQIPTSLIDTKSLLDLFEKYNSVTYYAGGGGGGGKGAGGQSANPPNISLYAL
ncbi:hypothetical protein B9Z51_14675 [Limnohabitans sp. T6-5]|uniref:hypothetical protein n=1 Tax=Limnohabitans sp. T6-5 TaxID=1100724 RepID=UPI000D355AFE|nr:hypothetical protein [Limnohabitans sp. T6-5]PUE07117.1 hypothetical protein B9Z51_14675 [Limnohabitans sp. T6-5]